jgi:hypothetical protein
MIDRDDGQNFHVERTTKGLACVKFYRDADEEFDWIQNDLLDGYSGESATQLMRQGGWLRWQWCVILACEQWVNVKESAC